MIAHFFTPDIQDKQIPNNMRYMYIAETTARISVYAGNGGTILVRCPAYGERVIAWPEHVNNVHVSFDVVDPNTQKDHAVIWFSALPIRLDLDKENIPTYDSGRGTFGYPVTTYPTISVADSEDKRYAAPLNAIAAVEKYIDNSDLTIAIPDRKLIQLAQPVDAIQLIIDDSNTANVPKYGASVAASRRVAPTYRGIAGNASYPFAVSSALTVGTPFAIAYIVSDLSHHVILSSIRLQLMSVTVASEIAISLYRQYTTVNVEGTHSDRATKYVGGLPSNTKVKATFEAFSRLARGTGAAWNFGGTIDLMSTYQLDLGVTGAVPTTNPVPQPCVLEMVNNAQGNLAAPLTDDFMGANSVGWTVLAECSVNTTLKHFSIWEWTEQNIDGHDPSGDVWAL